MEGLRKQIIAANEGLLELRRERRTCLGEEGGERHWERAALGPCLERIYLEISLGRIPIGYLSPFQVCPFWVMVPTDWSLPRGAGQRWGH